MKRCSILWSIAIAQSVFSMHVPADEVPVTVELARTVVYTPSNHTSYELTVTPARPGIEVTTLFKLDDEDTRAGAFQLQPKHRGDSYIFAARCIGERFIKKSHFAIQVQEKATSKSLGRLVVQLDEATDKPQSEPSDTLNPLLLEIPSAIAKSQDEMKPYDEIIEHTAVKFRMIPIRGGDFLMGSPKGELNRANDEGPQRKVTISPFWMAETETTWDAFLVWVYDLDVKKRKELGIPGNARDRLADQFQSQQPEASYYKEDMGMGFEGRPAIRMTQLAARTYCKWLSAKTGRYYRLPTEAEWEYACRAGTSTAYSWGDDPEQLDEYAWYYGNTNDAAQTGKVREKKPNPWGLYDMHGNVSEWVLDQFEHDYYQHRGESTNPLNVPQTLYPRVVRGGSYLDDPEKLRSAARQRSSRKWMSGEPRVPHGIWWHRGEDWWFGFRVVRPLKMPTEEEKLAKWDAQVPSKQREKYLRRIPKHLR